MTTQKFSKYSQKLVRAGLISEGGLFVGTRGGAATAWYGSSRLGDVLEGVRSRLNLGAVVLTRPAEPYATIVDFLVRTALGFVIHPQDFETHLLLRDLPVVSDCSEAALVRALEQRKAVIIPEWGILAVDERCLEQAIAVTSAVYFACFVKFFSDRLQSCAHKDCSGIADVFEKVCRNLPALPDSFQPLAEGPFATEEEILHAIAEVGTRTVDARLVDANFGNVSYRQGNRLYITKSKSSLDELEGQILAVPLGEDPNGSSELASIELPSHREIILSSDYRAILHGHPRFAVILSMDCAQRLDCPDRNDCHVFCPRKRFVLDIPVVSGEAGGGPRGINHTLPPAMKPGGGVIVYGHGVFTASRTDFNEAFKRLLDIEKKCRNAYFERLAASE